MYRPIDLPFSQWRMLLTALFVVFLIGGALCSVRIIMLPTPFGSLELPGGVFYIPICFSILAVVEEVYGLLTARRLAEFGVFCLAIVALMIEIVVRLPFHSPDGSRAEEFDHLFTISFSPIVITVIAFYVGTQSTAWIMRFMALNTRGRLLWLRICGAPMAAQIVTTLVGLPLIFWSELTPHQILELLVQRISFAVFFASLTAPLVYWAVLSIRKVEWPPPVPHLMYPDDFRGDNGP